MSSNKVEILGRYYTIRGIEDTEYLEKLATFVDQHMRQIVSATGTVDTLKVAILAALTISDSYFKANEGVSDTDADLERSINALCEQIDMVLTP